MFFADANITHDQALFRILIAAQSHRKKENRARRINPGAIFVKGSDLWGSERPRHDN